MWIAIGVFLVAAWLMLKLVWNVASFGVHFLLAAGILALIAHFARGYFGRDVSRTGV
jgi:hypothetical protein